MKVTVLGATGGIGRAISHELHDRGHDVATASRSGDPVLDGVPSTAFDVHDRAATVAACAGAEVVVMAAQPSYPDWVEEFPRVVDNVLAAAEVAGARLVFVDNLYMDAPADGPLAEDSPEHATDPKGRLRRELGETLLAAHRADRVRVTIGRFSDYYGPGGTNSGLFMMGIAPAMMGIAPAACATSTSRTPSTSCPTPPGASRPWWRTRGPTVGPGCFPPRRRSPSATCSAWSAWRPVRGGRACCPTR